jgi:hypothetical protein
VLRHLLIIARRDPVMYATTKRSFAGHTDIEVVLDRRRGERRRQTLAIELNRRVSERRTMDIDALLQRLGWVIVEQTSSET